VIPDEAPWLSDSGLRSSGSSFRSGGYQSLPSSSVSRGPPSRVGLEEPIPTKPAKRIKPYEESSSRDPLPEGCVDLFVAESESSGDESEDSSVSKNVWKKMKGRLQSDINDFTTQGARLQ
jgi:hypothetical protein